MPFLQMFHNDFGHFMGHVKAKAGIRRERTPFVLTKDFMNAVTGGDAGHKEKVTELMLMCFELFMTIRRNGTLFLTLLNLMSHCNLPELNCQEDITYCRARLGMDKPDHEVAKQFFLDLYSSYKKQWTVNLNFFFHRINKAVNMKSPSQECLRSNQSRSTSASHILRTLHRSIKHDWNTVCLNTNVVIGRRRFLIYH
ncbi:phosphatidylinositol 4,5-bisphosphate 3-kinase catalytic subunit beta isoform-like [Mya arenaria]|uniref:phosphatidylinositol 4,5-bisphosphate 3-kinase catalytic subunit beta isoform-like n=1 Tax=Mya arenaria TaxID=6604 RepID=UPI0022E08861|nr:phosphatidylinositol 4,5-bisphosphate 3-kinase catalytic subunit beta isoform-like [Mya arenaria]